MNKYKITRNTLSNWVKKRKWIMVEKMLMGRYIYRDKKRKIMKIVNVTEYYKSKFIEQYGDTYDYSKWSLLEVI